MQHAQHVGEAAAASAEVKVTECPRIMHCQLHNRQGKSKVSADCICVAAVLRAPLFVRSPKQQLLIMNFEDLYIYSNTV